jgi:hypothetical protein
MHISSDIKPLFSILQKQKLPARFFFGNLLPTDLIVLNGVGITFTSLVFVNRHVGITDNTKLTH